MATVKQLITDGEAALTQSESDSARLDTELLLGFAIKQTRTWLYTWPEHIPSLPEQHLFLELIRRRKSGEPIAYLTGRREFWNLALKINQHVLIPRPETELLVETALSRLAGFDTARVADLGTGSGAIALALAAEKPGWHITATDESAEALKLATENAELFSITNVSFEQGDWTSPLQEHRFNAILSNPPYIEENDPHLQMGDIRFEPEHALVAPDHGLADINTIINDCFSLIEADGWLMIEHGYRQGEQVRQLFSDKGYGEIETVRDLAGNERLTIGTRIQAPQ